ncbi:MAG: hypothetical protein Q4D62_11180 [Planctomycetia bacterium]|nr:hypothetical protein [Planctomycetia bacterium]
MRLLRRILLIGFLLMLLLAGVGLWVWYGIGQTPTFYADLAVTAEKRAAAEEDCKRMTRKVLQLRNQMNRQGAWSIEMTQDELNHWIALELEEKHPGFISRRILQPRGEILGEKIRAGATIDAREFQGVASVEVIPSLEGPNIINIEFLRIQAGIVPLPRKILLDFATEKAREYALPIQWRQSHGNPVLRVVLNEQEFRVHGRPQVLERLEVGDGKIVLEGKCLE